jgi:imidazolonepropionase-like amidohydrolase
LINKISESGHVMGQQFQKPSIELQKAVVDEAHKAGLKVVAHATCLADTLEILDAGVDGLAHCFIDQPPNEEVIAAYKKNGAHLNPTLSAMGSGTTEGQKMQEKFAHDPRVQHLIGEGERGRMCMCMQFAQRAGASFENAFVR